MQLFFIVSQLKNLVHAKKVHFSRIYLKYKIELNWIINGDKYCHPERVLGIQNSK